MRRYRAGLLKIISYSILSVTLFTARRAETTSQPSPPSFFMSMENVKSDGDAIMYSHRAGGRIAATPKKMPASKIAVTACNPMVAGADQSRRGLAVGTEVGSLTTTCAGGAGGGTKDACSKTIAAADGMRAVVRHSGHRTLRPACESSSCFSNPHPEHRKAIIGSPRSPIRPPAVFIGGLHA